MRHGLVAANFIGFNATIETYTRLRVCFTLNHVVSEAESIARSILENGTIDVSLAVPNTTNYPVYMLYLKEGEKLQFCKVLEHADTFNVPLLQKRFYFFRLIQARVHLDEFVQNSLF